MKHFTLTQEHLALVTRMFVEYDDCCEFGAPIIDPKRPYGNSDVYDDISNILGLEPSECDKYEKWFSDEQTKYMKELHKQTATALQIILRTQKFECGNYVADAYDENWRRV